MDAETYSLAVLGNEFVCFSDGKAIPYSSLNDDYCDCDDGSDEPSTAACSHILGSEHCCDGTDEWLNPHGNTCSNTCRSEAVASSQENALASKKSLVNSLHSKYETQRMAATTLNYWNQSLLLLKSYVETMQKRFIDWKDTGCRNRVTIVEQCDAGGCGYSFEMPVHDPLESSNLLYTLQSYLRKYPPNMKLITFLPTVITPTSSFLSNFYYYVTLPRMRLVNFWNYFVIFFYKSFSFYDPCPVSLMNDWNNYLNASKEVIRLLEVAVSKEYGPDDFFISHYEKCLRKNILGNEQEEFFEFCFFGNVTRVQNDQRVLLGVYKELKNDILQMEFSDGDPCTVDEKYSTSVNFVCGTNEEILKVLPEENYYCTYTIHVASPVACFPNMMRNLKDETLDKEL
ncbi:hypothetical protein IE077_003872 [Cardiosporidium cionae]|uniref:Glucosidase 2 subunit beta n=1 Tax=Cardiosporidium cionae TaxID=476202 RepID=A0ABQ7J795_9APIC|nr:hypothetical protein IE077_003872 [Cardiosporidium cionae]|eukprot:KAF8819866.1 hypothetical protein IE077_003872 [Cardiosporidium cionae]